MTVQIYNRRPINFYRFWKLKKCQHNRFNRKYRVCMESHRKLESAEASGLRACRGPALGSILQSSNPLIQGEGLPSPYPLPGGSGRRVVGGLESLRAPQTASRRFKTAPRRLQDGSRTLQDGSKTPQDAPKTFQDTPETLQDTRKTPSRHPQAAYKT